MLWGRKKGWDVDVMDLVVILPKIWKADRYCELSLTGELIIMISYKLLVAWVLKISIKLVLAGTEIKCERQALKLSERMNDPLESHEK